MGLFDSLIKGAIGGAMGGGAKEILIEHVLGMISNEKTGGLAGLTKEFTKKGLGDVVNSWIGTGQNMPISADQVAGVLGSSKIKSLAEKAGVSPEEISGGLAHLFPEIIDSLTPNGSVPDSDTLSKGLGSIRKLIGL
jgi:uncharacterized protein YidB (DUF937 family)